MLKYWITCSLFCYRNIAFFAGSILAVMLALSFYDQDVLTAEHAISFMVMLGEIRLEILFFSLIFLFLDLKNRILEVFQTYQTDIFRWFLAKILDLESMNNITFLFWHVLRILFFRYNHQSLYWLCSRWGLIWFI